MIQIETLKLNDNNPRFIRDERFQKLKDSIEQFPKMMALRPIVTDNAGVVLGGNMRLRALIDLGYKSIPKAWVKKADELNEEEKRRFIIADNTGFGEWDWEVLANDWEEIELKEWGLELPDWGNTKALEKVNDENEEWVDMPEFEKADKEIKLTMYFENEQQREQFCIEKGIEVTKKNMGQWTCRISDIRSM